MSEAVAEKTNVDIKAAYLAAEDLKLAASLLYQLQDIDIFNTHNLSCNRVNLG